MLLKVDGVSTGEEARVLQARGANVITVAIGEACRDGVAVLTPEAAEGLRSAIHDARYCGELGAPYLQDVSAARSLVERCQLDLVQLSGTRLPSRDLSDALRTSGVDVVYADLGLDHDDDPSWPLAGLVDAGLADSALCQLQVLPDMRDAWRSLSVDSRGYPELVQLEEVAELTESFALLLGLDYSARNVAEIVRAFPRAAGIAMTLSAAREQPLYHAFEMGAVLSVLDAVRAAGGRMEGPYRSP